MTAIDSFITWGSRVFAVHTRWMRVPFQPIVMLFMWAAALRITVSDTLPPIQFSQMLTPHGELTWTITALSCPPMALVAWWLIAHSCWNRSSLAGLWLRLGADLGQFCVVITYHIVATITADAPMDEDGVYSRYITAAVLAFLVGVIVRDAWSLISVERVAHGIRADG